MEQTAAQTQRAFLVGLERPARVQGGWTANESLDELERLVDTAGGTPVGRAVQARSTPDVATFIGGGKAEEVEEHRRALEFDVVVFDTELSPVQQRNLEEIIQCQVVDRTTVILDIFAQRARTREARLQVELAQLQFRLPRLTGKGVDLSRLGGGIGTRGPGETKLEVDRRRIRERISTLRDELEEVRAHRDRPGRVRQGPERPGHRNRRIAVTCHDAGTNGLREDREDLPVLLRAGDARLKLEAEEPASWHGRLQG